MMPRRESNDSFGRDVRQILSAQEVGLRWGDNVSSVVDFDYLAASAPYDVRTTENDIDAVVCLRARRKTDGVLESMCRVVWESRAGAVRIFSVDVSDTSIMYQVRLGFVRT